jgi:hypothetical protein
MTDENAGFDYGRQLSFRFSFTFRGMGARGHPISFLFTGICVKKGENGQ